MRKFFIPFLLILGFQTAVIAQEKVYMSYFETINMNKDYQYSTSKLLKMYIDNVGKYEIILSKRDSNLVIETKEQAQEKAKALHANHFITGELNRSGETVIVSVSLFKTEDGSKEWGIMQKASSPNDLDPIMQKIASGLNVKDPKSTEGDIYNVTNYESKELNKMTATTAWGFEVGGGAGSLHAVSNHPAGFSALYSGDLRTAIIDVKGSLYFSDISMGNICLHVNVPLTQKRNSFLVSGGLGYGYTNLQKKFENSYNNMVNETLSNSGLTAFAGGGYILNRNASITMRFTANGFFSMYTIDNSYPFGVLIGMSVSFNK